MRVAYLITRMDSIGGAQIHVRDTMGEKARASYEARFTIELMLRPTLGIYRSVLAGAAQIGGRASDQAVARSPVEF